MNQANNILVLDGDQSSALAIVRSLGKKGLNIDLGSSEQYPMTARSRYCSDYFTYPDPMKDPDGFRKTIMKRLQGRSYSLFIPVTDRTIIPLMEIRSDIEKHCPIAMASDNALRACLSKRKTEELSIKLGIPVPKTIPIDSIDDLKLHEMTLSYPVVLKSDQSKVWSKDGAGRVMYTAYAADPEQLKVLLEEFLLCGPVLLQEYVTGVGVGIGALAWKGELLKTFQYRRLHEVPISGGGSSYRISEPVDSKLKKYAESFLRALSWDGVVMLEFKQNIDTGEIWLIEINGRFWGSLALASASGVDFPFNLYETYLHGKREFDPDYRIGVRCRDLAREIDWFKEALLRRPDPFTTYPSYSRALIDAIRLFNPFEYWDTQSIADPKPGIYQARNVAQRYLEALARKIRERKARKLALKTRNNPEKLIKKLKNANAIQIACYGNIIRSPFAAALLAQKLQNNNSVKVASSGVGAIPGRKAEPFSIKTAKEWGIDLSQHSARKLTEDDVDKADVILVMGIDHMLRIWKDYPNAIDKTFLFTSLAPEIELEVPDPVSKGPTVFRTAYGLIDKAVDPIVKAISN